MLGKLFGKKKSSDSSPTSPQKKESTKEIKKIDEIKELEAKWSKVYSNLDSSEKKQFDSYRTQLGKPKKTIFLNS